MNRLNATLARLLLGLFAALMLAVPTVGYGQEGSEDRGRRGGWGRSEDGGREGRRGRDRDRDRRRNDDDEEEKPAYVAPARSLSPANESMGFGKPKAAAEGRGFSSSQPAGAPSSNTSDKDREYARGLLSKYDTNGNRVLDEDEWKQISGDPQKADTNRDKRITYDELVARVANKRREKEVGAMGNSYGDLRSYRLATATEKLPEEGLPSWFNDRDRDDDGQVSMHEWSRSWNSSTVRDFTSKDADGDGIITVSEAIELER
jgi:Ca2+-binding EF-hand superfamily protein